MMLWLSQYCSSEPEVGEKIDKHNHAVAVEFEGAVQVLSSFGPPRRLMTSSRLSQTHASYYPKCHNHTDSVLPSRGSGLIDEM